MNSYKMFFLFHCTESLFNFNLALCGKKSAVWMLKQVTDIILSFFPDRIDCNFAQITIFSVEKCITLVIFRISFGLIHP